MNKKSFITLTPDIICKVNITTNDGGNSSKTLSINSEQNKKLFLDIFFWRSIICPIYHLVNLPFCQPTNETLWWCERSSVRHLCDSQIIRMSIHKTSYKIFFIICLDNRRKQNTLKKNYPEYFLKKILEKVSCYSNPTILIAFVRTYLRNISEKCTQVFIREKCTSKIYIA